MWYYIIAVALSAVCAILLICCFSTAHKEAARRERERKRREAKLDREMKDWRRQQREAFHFDAQKFLDSFLTRNGEDAPACPFCGGNQYDVLDKMAIVRNQVGLLDARGYAMPCAAILCRNCGRIEFFMLGGRYADINKGTWLCDEREAELEG